MAPSLPAIADAQTPGPAVVAPTTTSTNARSAVPRPKPAQKTRVAQPVDAALPVVARSIAPPRESMLVFAPELTKSQIRERAYFVYLARGGAAGDAASDWLEAERQLRQEARDGSTRPRSG